MQPCRMKKVPKSVCTFGEPGKMGRVKRSQQVAKRNGRQSDHTEQPASIEIMEKDIHAEAQSSSGISPARPCRGRNFLRFSRRCQRRPGDSRGLVAKAASGFLIHIVMHSSRKCKNSLVFLQVSDVWESELQAFSRFSFFVSDARDSKL